MHKKVYRKFLILIIVIGNVLSFPIFVSSESGNGMTFSMAMTIPDNQIDKKAVYYDLLVKPSTEQELKMTITNMSDKKNKIKITPANARTNENGIISYIPAPSNNDDDNNLDSSLKIPFTSLVEPTKEITLKPLETKEVTMKLTIPKSEFDGTILGSFIISSNTDQGKKVKQGELRNEFQITQGVMLRQTLDDVPTQFKINDIKSGLYQNQVSILTNIQNISPKLMKNVTIKTSLRKKNSTNIIAEQEANDIELAPNSNFDYPLMLDNQTITPGTYTMDIDIKYDKDILSYSKDFQITKNDIYLNNSTQSQNKSSSMPILKILLITLIIFIVVVCLFFSFKNRSKIKEIILNKLNK